jgi:hypothetical protein
MVINMGGKFERTNSVNGRIQEFVAAKCPRHLEEDKPTVGVRAEPKWWSHVRLDLRQKYKNRSLGASF